VAILHAGHVSPFLADECAESEAAKRKARLARLG